MAMFFGQLDINISPHLSSEYISYLENPVELLNEATKAAEKDLWTLIQFTEDLRRRYGKEPRDMEVCHCQYLCLHDQRLWVKFRALLCFVILSFLQLLLKNLYVRRMAADLGISQVYPSGKMILMKTNMNKKVFRLMTEAMTSETYRNSLSYAGKEIKVKIFLCQLPIIKLFWSR